MVWLETLQQKFLKVFWRRLVVLIVWGEKFIWILIKIIAIFFGVSGECSLHFKNLNWWLYAFTIAGLALILADRIFTRDLVLRKLPDISSFAKVKIYLNFWKFHWRLMVFSELKNNGKWEWRASLLNTSSSVSLSNLYFMNCWLCLFY